MTNALARTDTTIVATLWTPEQVSLIKRQIMPPNSSDDELALFAYVCKQRQLDPFARQIYAVRYSNKIVHQTSIDGFRLIAQRSGQYAGQDGPYWCGEDGVWVDLWLDKKPPAAAKVGVLRTGFRDYLYAVARWSNYASVNGRNVWASAPDLMLAKNAEALALRRAFPEELSGLYIPGEMQQEPDAAEPEDFDTQAARHFGPIRATTEVVTIDGEIKADDAPTQRDLLIEWMDSMQDEDELAAARAQITEYGLDDDEDIQRAYKRAYRFFHPKTTDAAPQPAMAK